VPIPGHVLAERVGSHLHLYNLYGHVRPYGIGTLMATYDSKNKHALYLLETSGVVHRYFGTAIGKHRQAAKNEIEKLKLSELACQEALVPVAKMFIGQRDDQKRHEIEMAWITEATGWKFQHVPVDVIQDAEASARAQLEDSDMDED
jgi:20S proteasome subunit alpha 7